MTEKEMTNEEKAEELVKENVCKKCGSKVCGFLIRKCDIALPRYEGVFAGLKANAERIKQLEKENAELKERIKSEVYELVKDLLFCTDGIVEISIPEEKRFLNVRKLKARAEKFLKECKE